MESKDKQQELLFRLVQEGDADIVHLPYTPAFEKICAAFSINKTSSIAKKHEIWEWVLEVTPRLQKEGPSAAAPEQRAAPTTNPVPSIAVVASHPPTKPSLSDFPNSLFDDKSVGLVQPWTVPAPVPLPSEDQQKRERILADIAQSRLGTCEQRVAFLLQRFPETRDSTTALCIRYWKRFQADIIEKWNPLELDVLFELDRLETIGRIRRHIQNVLCLFRGMEETSHFREFLQKEFHEYLASHRGATPEIRFYLDETGNEGDKSLLGVSGVCIMNWQQYEKHHAALARWRRAQNWAETIHFAETGADRIDRAVRLLGELEKRRSGLLFLGYALHSRGRTHEDLSSLFIQLVIDSLHRLKDSRSLDSPRSLRIVKEADPGFDNLVLPKMQKQLEDLVAIEFPDQVFVHPIECVTKGREVFLECADLIAGGMQRRTLYKGRNPKDKVAETVFNVTGFEDAMDSGAVYNFFP